MSRVRYRSGDRSRLPTVIDNSYCCMTSHITLYTDLVPIIVPCETSVLSSLSPSSEVLTFAADSSGHELQTKTLDI